MVVTHQHVGALMASDLGHLMKREHISQPQRGLMVAKIFQVAHVWPLPCLFALSQVNLVSSFKGMIKSLSDSVFANIKDPTINL